MCAKMTSAFARELVDRIKQDYEEVHERFPIEWAQLTEQEEAELKDEKFLAKYFLKDVRS